MSNKIIRQLANIIADKFNFKDDETKATAIAEMRDNIFSFTSIEDLEVIAKTHSNGCGDGLSINNICGPDARFGSGLGYGSGDGRGGGDGYAADASSAVNDVYDAAAVNAADASYNLGLSEGFNKGLNEGLKL